MVLAAVLGGCSGDLLKPHLQKIADTLVQPDVCQEYQQVSLWPLTYGYDLWIWPMGWELGEKVNAITTGPGSDHYPHEWSVVRGNLWWFTSQWVEMFALLYLSLQPGLVRHLVLTLKLFTVKGSIKWKIIKIRCIFFYRDCCKAFIGITVLWGQGVHLWVHHKILTPLTATEQGTCCFHQPFI